MLKEVITQDLKNRIDYHKEIGGILKISVFEINENSFSKTSDEYFLHLIAARNTLEKVNFEWNLMFNTVPPGEREESPFAKTNYDLLDKSGIKISPKDFLGSCFDIEMNKPIIRGRLDNSTNNSYFYYDQEEIPLNAITKNKAGDYINSFHPEKDNFIRSLMEPPYSLQMGKEIIKYGDYAIDFIDYFFGDIKKMKIYTWDSNCSMVFDCGNEWWGSFLWTIYNPIKKWYIGILASATD